MEARPVAELHAISCSSEGSLKALIQSGLETLGFYRRIKNSALYDWYWTAAGGEHSRKKQQEKLFYEELLPPRDKERLIFDIGANEGAKTRVFLEMSTRVIAVDPDPHNQKILRDSFRAYRLRPLPVVIVPKAVSESSGSAIFWMSEPGGAKNSLNSKWVEELSRDGERFGHRLDFGQRMQFETTTLDELIHEFGVPDFIKIDVEGHEPAVLNGLRQPVPALSFEVNLPSFLEEGLRCVDRLEALAAGGRFNWSTDVTSGFSLEQWLDADSFREQLRACTLPSIEVFWRSRVIY